MRGIRQHGLMADVMTGLVLGFVTLALAGSYSLLIFNGILAPYAVWGVGTALVTAVVIVLWNLANHIPHDQISVPQDRIAPILGFMSAVVISAMGPGAEPGSVFSTLVVSIAISTLLTGLLVYGLGKFRLGNLIRFIPYPVIGGFLAGSGWLLVAGSMRTAAGVEAIPAGPGGLLSMESIRSWLPVLGFGGGLFFLQRAFRHWSVLPGFLALNVAVFYLVMAGAGWDVETMRREGWLMRMGGGGPVDWPGFPGLLLQVDWLTVLGLGGAFSAVALTSTVSILLNSSALDVENRRETDLNRELRILGVGNLLAGLGGGMVGFTSLSLSRLAREAGGRSRWVSAVLALVCAVFLAGHMEAVGYIPKYVLGRPSFLPRSVVPA